MERPHPDRQLREARASYIAAVRRLDAALRAFDDSGTPMDPGPDVDEPYPWAADQISIIYAATNGYLDDLPVEQVKPFEAGLLPFLRDRYGDVIHGINSTRALAPETEARHVDAVPQAIVKRRDQVAAMGIGRKLANMQLAIGSVAADAVSCLGSGVDDGLDSEPDA